jgi:polyisoprenoid-binding protein YceI
MTKTLLMIGAIALLASCNNSPEGAKTETAEATTAATATGTNYTIDAATSTVGWEGNGVGHGHKGIFKLNNGSLSAADGNISAGNFEINIGSLDNTDDAGDKKKDLIGHLLSPDFFDAAKFPTAKFAITACEALTGDSTATHKISGNLTLKDSTKNVTFPAKVTLAGDAISATAKFVIDRSTWGMSYGNDKSLKDKFISPEVGIELNINGKK